MKYRIITPEQYKQGYITPFNGSKPFVLVRRLEDGNYLVTG